MDKVDLSHSEEQIKHELQNDGTCGRIGNDNRALPCTFMDVFCNKNLFNWTFIYEN